MEKETLLNNYDQVVNSFYLAYFGRPADPAGQTYWVQQLQNTKGDLGVLTTGFAASAESVAHFGGIDVAARVATIYQQLFNRTPEAAGLQYWTEAVEKGHVTVAELAMNILHGAQSADSTVSALRQEAAAEFTTAVASTGIKFEGYAAVEASRALIAAVSAATPRESIASLVKTAGALVDVAHDTPAVIEALGAGGKLVPLFATARGQAEPQNLLQTLADLGKTAAGDPSTLESLLRGGSMNKVLEVMPSQATLHDVVEALGSGGLSAAVEVVYPSAPPVQAEPTPVEPTPTVPTPVEPTPTVPTPVEPTPTVPTPTEPTAPADIVPPALKSIVAGPNDGKLALLERMELTVAFDAPVNVDGTPSIRFANGGTAVYVSGSGTDTLVFKYVPQPGQSTPALTLAQDAAFSGTISDLAGNKLPANAFDGLALDAPVAVDAEAPAQTLLIIGIQTAEALSGNDLIDSALMTNLPVTRVIAALLAPLADGEHVEYSLDNGQNWSRENMLFERNLVAVDAVPTTGNPTLMMRVRDAAGNAGPVASRAIVLDTEAPDGGTLAFLKVTESAADAQPDNVTNQATVTATFSHSGAWPAEGERLQYSIDGFNWKSEGLQLDQERGLVTISGIDLSLARLNDDGSRTTTVSVRAIDGAHNVSEATKFAFTLDTTAPSAPELKLALDSGASPTDKVTNAGQVIVSGLEGSSGSFWEYSLDGGAWQRGNAVVDGKSSLEVSGDGTHSVLVHQVDAAGNVGNDASFGFTLDTKAPLLSFDHVQGATTNANVTDLPQADVVFAYQGAVDAGDTVEYQVNGGGWQAVGPNAVDPDAHTITLYGMNLSAADPTFQLRVTDAAGNQSNTASVDIDGPYGATALTFTPTAQGLMVTSPVDGAIELDAYGDINQVFTVTQGGAVAGGTVLVGAQANVVGGVVQVTPASGSSLQDPNAQYYTLGTDDNETFSGLSYVWGFGGNDTFIGTAGKDVIYSGDGVNTITGGAGADQIDISLGRNTLKYAAGHSTVNGGIDVVTFAATASPNQPVQTFQFATMPATSYRVDNVANPADASNAALVAALDAAYQAKTGGSAMVAVVIGFENGDTYLVVDTGNGAISGTNDYVVKLVGHIPNPYVMGGDVIFGAAP